MSESTPVGETIVPVKITEPEEAAPPSLAEPASGPAAEMSGALAQGDAPSADTGSKPAERKWLTTQCSRRMANANLSSFDSC